MSAERTLPQEIAYHYIIPSVPNIADAERRFTQLDTTERTTVLGALLKGLGTDNDPERRKRALSLFPLFRLNSENPNIDQEALLLSFLDAFSQQDNTRLSENRIRDLIKAGDYIHPALQLDHNAQNITKIIINKVYNKIEKDTPISLEIAEFRDKFTTKPLDESKKYYQDYRKMADDILKDSKWKLSAQEKKQIRQTVDTVLPSHYKLLTDFCKKSDPDYWKLTSAIQRGFVDGEKIGGRIYADQVSANAYLLTHPQEKPSELPSHYRLLTTFYPAGSEEYAQLYFAIWNGAVDGMKNGSRVYVDPTSVDSYLLTHPQEKPSNVPSHFKLLANLHKSGNQQYRQLYSAIQNGAVDGMKSGGHVYVDPISADAYLYRLHHNQAAKTQVFP